MGQRQQAVYALQNPRQTSKQLRLESAHLITSTMLRQLCESSAKRGVCYHTDGIVAIADTIVAFQDPQQRSLLDIYPLSVSDNLF